MIDKDKTEFAIYSFFSIPITLLAASEQSRYYLSMVAPTHYEEDKNPKGINETWWVENQKSSYEGKRKKFLKKFSRSNFLTGRRKGRMVRDLEEGGTRNGKSIKLYWTTLGVKQEDGKKRNKTKGETELNGEYLNTGIFEDRTE